MKINSNNSIYDRYVKKINFSVLKKIFFISSLLYFCSYFFNNFNQISFKVDLQENFNNIYFAFLFCIFSIFFNAFAWKNIVLWFGETNNNKNFVSNYVLTNILKYVPGGIWHFVERFNFVKNISNYKIAFYSVIVEPYFMLCAAFLLASFGVIFSPFYLFLVIPLVFLNRNLIYFVLNIIDSVRGMASSSLKISSSKLKLEKRIELTSFFPFKAFLIEIGFILSKFIGFLFCFNIVNSANDTNLILLFVIFCLSWSIGLIVPTAPSGIGVFESCFLFLIGKDSPQNILFVSLIYFRLISTAADLTLSLPYLLRKMVEKI